MKSTTKSSFDSFDRIKHFTCWHFKINRFSSARRLVSFSFCFNFIFVFFFVLLFQNRFLFRCSRRSVDVRTAHSKSVFCSQSIFDAICVHWLLLTLNEINCHACQTAMSFKGNINNEIFALLTNWSNYILFLRLFLDCRFTFSRPSLIAFLFAFHR